MTAALLALLLAQTTWKESGILVRDESATQGYAKSVNCTGAGVACTSTGYVWTINVAGGGGGAPTTATYITQTPDAGLSAEQALSTLGTGLVQNTTGTGVLTIYGGATCTAPNFVQQLSATGAATCAQPTNVTGNSATTTALAADPTDCTLPQVALGINASGTAQCSQPTSVTGNAATATALAADPGDCTGNNFALGINASGTAACAQPTFGNLSGSASIGQGGTTETASTEDAVLVGAGTTDWAAAVLPSCSNATTSKLLYDTATNAFSCGTDQTSAGGGYATIQDETTPLTQRTTVNFTGAGVSCADNAGSTRTDCTVSGAPVYSGLTAGGVMYASSTTADTSTGTGTSGRSVLTSGGTGAPTWVQNTRGINMTQDRTTSSTTAATTTDLTWSINASEGQAFTCNLTSTSTATSKIRYAVAGPASMTQVNCRVLLGTTSLTTLVSNMIQAQWASTCTGCTNSVTASVLTSGITDVLSCSVINGTNAGSITIYFAASTAGQTMTLRKGSGCFVTGGG